MSAASPVNVDRPRPTAHPISPTRLAWLEAQTVQWRDAGLIDGDTATAIRSRYVADRRVSIVSVVLTLGACFLGAGFIWLVASNLDQLSPLVRFALAAALWVALTILAEWLAGRAERIDPGDRHPVVGAVRLLATAGFVGTLFQTAQSLQVPIDTPWLFGCAALGCLVYAYAVRAVGPLIAGIAFIPIWWTSWVAPGQVGPRTALLGFAAVGVAAAALAAVHARRNWAEAAIAWRDASVGFALVALAGSALPIFGEYDVLVVPTVLAIVVAALAVALGLGVGARDCRAEIATAAVAFAGVGVLGLLPGRPYVDATPPPDYLRASVAIPLFLLVAGGYVVLGTTRRDWRISAMAVLGIVVFVTMQAFAVFSEILHGASLFLLVGAVLLVTGLVVERSRRRLVAHRQADEATDAIRPQRGELR